jgi:hypothetical protein
MLKNKTTISLMEMSNLNLHGLISSKKKNRIRWIEKSATSLATRQICGIKNCYNLQRICQIELGDTWPINQTPIQRDSTVPNPFNSQFRFEWFCQTKLTINFTFL